MGITNRSWDSAFIATPSDTLLEPTGPFAGFIVWTSGTVNFIDQAGNTSGASGTIAPGTTIFVKGVQIKATGTSAIILLLKAPA